MKLALLAFHVRWILPLQLLLAVLGGFFGKLTVAVPSLSGGGQLPVTLLCAMLGVILLALPTNSTWPANRTVATRPPAVVLAAVVGITIAPAMLTGVALGLVADASTGLQYVGSYMWLLAIQLSLGVLVSGRMQALGPALYVLVCALLGRVDSSVQPWAWPLADIAPAIALSIGCVSLAIATILLLVMGLHDAEGS
ncbi:MAG: hypothetical protein ACK4V6_10330 [Microthrixaceae bacterium]